MLDSNILFMTRDNEVDISITEDGVEYILIELKSRDWSPSDLAKRSGLSRSQISRILNREQGFGFESAVKIAHAFKIRPEKLLVLAGILPRESEETRELAEINYKISQLPPDKQLAIKEMVDFYLTKVDQEARTSLNGSGVHQP